MGLTLTTRAVEPSIMPRVEGAICALALQLLRRIARIAALDTTPWSRGKHAGNNTRV